VLVGVFGAAAGAAAGVLVDRWWNVSGAWANAGVAVVLAALGALVTVAAFAAFDRDVVRRLWRPGPPAGDQLDA
jgi:drug/metabolite transporter (DMT)-like permease